MRFRLVSLFVVAALAVTACGKNVRTENSALEPTAVLYPFEPIPIPSYEGMGLAKHKDIRISRKMARSQAMADLGSNIFDTVSSRVSEVISRRDERASLFTAVRNLSTNVPLAGKKFVEYRVGQNTGTVYCRTYRAKSELDEHLMDRFVKLSQYLIDNPIKEQLTRQLSGQGTVSADIQTLTLFHEQQLTRAKAENGGTLN